MGLRLTRANLLICKGLSVPLGARGILASWGHMQHPDPGRALAYYTDDSGFKLQTWQ